MDGYAGAQLRVNLSSGKITKEPLDFDVARKYIGGKGMGAYILHKETKPGEDPLGEEAKMIFASGPMDGTFLPGSGRFSVFFHSPYHGGLGETYIGGHIGPALKFAGYDWLIVEGKSDKPVYLFIDDDRVEVRDAEFLWGKDCYETEEALQNMYGQNCNVMSIGPGGENLVRFACIGHSLGRQAGRRGGGMIMGSKKLKAIAVHGTGGLRLAHADQLKEYYLKNREMWQNTTKVFTEFGTTRLLEVMNNFGAIPTKNWQDGTFDGVPKIDHNTIKKVLVVKDRACTGCHVACNKLSIHEQTRWGPLLVEGPEYETLFSLGTLVECDDIVGLARVNEVADRMGVDTITLGNVLAFGMECFEREHISVADTNGVELRWGDVDAMLKITEMIARRQAIGDVLAEGNVIAAEKIGKGTEDYVVTFHNVEPPAYDPRGLIGCSLSLAVSTKGACHVQGIAHRPILAGELDRDKPEGHGKVLPGNENMFAFRDSLVLCTFVMIPGVGPITFDEAATAYTLITGSEMPAEEAPLIGERIHNLAKLFNLREGHTKEMDAKVPKRLLEVPLKTGPAAGTAIKQEDHMAMLRDYYETRGWTQEGVPTEEKLKELGLEEFAPGR